MGERPIELLLLLFTSVPVMQIQCGSAQKKTAPIRRQPAYQPTNCKSTTAPVRASAANSYVSISPFFRREIPPR